MDDLGDPDEILEQVLKWINLGYTLTDCAQAFNIHRITMWRWLKKNNAWKGVYTRFTIPEVCWLISNTVAIEEHAMTWGTRFIHDHLRRLGYRISRNLIREALQVMMPEVLRVRYQGCLVRREYTIYQPMHVWHIDSQNLQGGVSKFMVPSIDGASHYVVYMHVCLNKKAPTILEAYRGAVQKFGHPLLILSDYAPEHNLVEQEITRARPNTIPFRRGPSVHNQRIEAFWRILREKATGYYQQALYILSFEEGSLQIDNPLHRSCIVSVFLPVLKSAVANFIATWNTHKVRAVNERGRRRPAHIPELAFQAVEREEGRIQPPPYPMGADLTLHDEIDPHAMGLNDINDQTAFAATDTWNHNDDAGCFEEGMRELEDQDLRYIRDLAYALNHNRVGLITLKFKMHLSLTMECQLCWDASMPLETYLESRLVEVQLPADSFLALTILRNTLENCRAR